MWLKEFLLSHGFRLEKANQAAINSKTISKCEYLFLMGRTCDQLRLQEEILLHSGAFHAAEYLQKAITELECLQDMVAVYDDTQEDNTDDKNTDSSEVQGAKVLKFNEKRPA